MNEYLNHLKLMYQNVREIASDTIVLFDSRLQTLLYISDAFISDVSFVIVCPCNIVVVLRKIPESRDKMDVHIFRDNKLDKSFRSEYLLDTILYQILTYLVTYCPDLAIYDKLLSVHNLLLAKTRLDTLDVIFTVTHSEVRGSLITTVTPEKPGTYRSYIICNGMVYHKQPLIEDNGIVCGYTIEYSNDKLFLVDITTGDRRSIAPVRLFDKEVPFSALYHFTLKEFPNKFVFISGIPTYYHLRGLDILIDIPKDGSKPRECIGSILSDKCTFIKYDADRNILYLCDCNDRVSLSGTLLHTLETYPDLDSYLDLLVVTDKFVYDTVHKLIYETKITDAKYYDNINQQEESRSILVLISKDFRFYISGYDTACVKVTEIESKPSIVELNDGFLLVNANGYLIADQFFETEFDARFSLYDPLDPDIELAKANNISFSPSSVTSTKIALISKLLEF